MLPLSSGLLPTLSTQWLEMGSFVLCTCLVATETLEIEGWVEVGRQETAQPGSDALLCLFLFLGVPCTENDYKLWSPSDERGNECLLGHKTVFKRRTPHATCFNGEDFDRPVVVSNCSCTREDYEWCVPPPWPGPWVVSYLLCSVRLKDGRACSVSQRKGIAFIECAFWARNCVRHFLLPLSSNSTAIQLSRGVASQSFSHFCMDS